MSRFWKGNIVDHQKQRISAKPLECHARPLTDCRCFVKWHAPCPGQLLAPTRVNLTVVLEIDFVCGQWFTANTGVSIG